MDASLPTKPVYSQPPPATPDDDWDGLDTRRPPRPDPADAETPPSQRDGDGAPPSVEMAEASGEDLDALLGDMADAVVPGNPSDNSGPAPDEETVPASTGAPDADLSAEALAQADLSAVADDDPTRVMGVHDVPRIADAEFDTARAAGPPSGPPSARAFADATLDDLSRRDALGKLASVNGLSQNIAALPAATLQNMATILADGLWIGDEAALRETMIVALIAFDQTTYAPMRPGLEKTALEDLMNAFLVELKERRLPCHQKLYDGRPRRITRPPPLPPVIREKPLPPRPGRKR